MDVSEYTQAPYEYIQTNLIEDEGIKYVGYLDTRGITSCGIGHNCQTNPTTPIIGRNIKVGMKLSHDEVIKLYDHDLKNVLARLQSLPFFKSLTENQAMVLISMTFNMGYDGLLKFRDFLEAIEAHDIQNAQKEMLDSKWAKQVPTRCKKLVKLLES
jgi:lysozyme